MRRILTGFLVSIMVFSALLWGTEPVYAKAGKDKGGWMPPGQAKKLVVSLEKLFEVKKLTRAQAAQILAERNEGFDEYTPSAVLLARVTDLKAVPAKYQKAMAYVIEKKLLSCKELPNGKLLFQPNKQLVWNELRWLLDGEEDDAENPDLTTLYTGTVKLVYQIGTNTWVVLETANGLRTAYFASSNRPSELGVGDLLTIRVDDFRIVYWNRGQENPVNILKANQSNVETDTSGFATIGHDITVGATLSRVTAEKWQGQSSLQVTTSGTNSWQGVNAYYQGSALTGTYTFSFYIKAPQGTPLRGLVYNNTGLVYPEGGKVEFTASGTWERHSVTFNLPENAGDLALQVTLNNRESATVFYLDGLQLEKSSSATAWIPGVTGS